MLSFEEIEDCFPNGAVSLPDGWIGVTAQWMHDLARAIEAAVLPEGYALISIAQLKTWGCYEVVDAMCQYPTQAEKQEPVKDEPVAWMVDTSYDKLIFQNAEQAEHFASKWDIAVVPLYTRPQPDLTAEVKRLGEMFRHKVDQCNEFDVELHKAKQRIAELEEAAREALDALQYKLHVVEAIAKLDAVLGDAEADSRPD